MPHSEPAETRRAKNLLQVPFTHIGPDNGVTMRGWRCSSSRPHPIFDSAPDNGALSEKPAPNLRNVNARYLARSVGKLNHLDAASSDVKHMPLDFRESDRKRRLNFHSQVPAFLREVAQSHDCWKQRVVASNTARTTRETRAERNFCNQG
jgi:hypothetical protein